jgi:hypothetical protein
MVIVLEIIGVLLVSYGLLRESFAALAKPRPFGEGRFGEGPFGGGLTPSQRRVVAVGTALRLLPKDAQLTLTDHKRNAAFAVAGVLIVVLAMIIQAARP